MKWLAWLAWLTWLKWLAWGAFGVLLLWLVAWLAVPPLLKSQLQSRLGAALGRTVSVGTVDFKPWTLELSVTDLVVGAVASAGAQAPPAREPLLRVARVHVDADIASVLRRAPVVEALEIDGLQLRVTRTAAGHYDIDDLIAKLQPSTPSDTPSQALHFALYNLRLRDAAVWFDDRPVRRVHELRSLDLSLPFLSNLPAQIDVKVEPRLAFRFNGTPFDSGAQATPFSRTHAASLKLKTGALDLVPYLGYLPEGLPLRVVQGKVAADLALDFEMPDGRTPRAVLRGTVDADHVLLNDAAGAPLAQWKRVALALREVQPLARRLALGELTIEAPQLHVSRDRSGQINWLQLAPASAAASGMSSRASGAASGAPAAQPWRVELASLNVSALRVVWNDATVQPAAALWLDDVALRAGPLKWPLGAAVPVRLSAALRVPPGVQVAAVATGAANAAASTTDAGRLDIEGQGSDKQAQFKLTLTKLALESLAPYLAAALRPAVAGALSASAQIDWATEASASAAASGPAAPTSGLRVSHAEATLDDLRISDVAVGKRAASPTLAWKQLALRDVQADVAARSLVLGSVKLQQPSATLQRNAKGEWNVLRWPVQQAVSASSRSANAKREVADPPWRVALRDLAVDGGQVRFSDALATVPVGPAGPAGLTHATPAQPVQFDLSALRLAVQNLALTGARSTAPAKVQLSARLVPGNAASGKLDKRASATLAWRGQVGVQPLLARGTLTAERLPLHLFEPYFGHRLNLSLVRADAGLKADLALQDTPAGIKLDLKGDALLADVLVQNKPVGGAGLDSAEDLLSWQSFTLKGLSVALAPTQRPRVEVAEASLSDFYSRLVITEQGRFNLQDVAPADEAASAASAASASAAAASQPNAGPPVDIVVAGTRLQRGSIDFTDRFVRPNYSAKLTELDGSLGAFRSGTRDMATLSLRGRAAGTALLDISGQLNPTAQPLALDIRARATDLELAPLSPYAGKYAGYAIERGKLSMDVAYKIAPDGTLDAKNQVVLNQLTFGDRIESPSATKLPVLLAVALLKDRHGVIDIDLPVSGSVNDPKFSVGAIIWKVILNLLVKALTAPFALLSGGGSDDLSVVEFVPGTSRVAASGGAALDKVAKALVERPALKMTVTGASDPVAEREAFQRAALEARLLAEHKRVRAGDGTLGDASVPVTLTADERARVLKEVYRQTDLPDKPRNLVGFAKDLPAAEMETRLLPRTAVTDEAMRELALQRALAVRDALIAKGLPSERLFLAAPKLRSAGDAVATASSAAPVDGSASSPSAGPWTPRVQLSLSTN